MQILTTAAGLQAYTEQARQAGQRIGLVPTMGALHDGHLQLVQAARSECDEVITSIFVNPTQFNNAEDFRLYPRVPEADAALLLPAGCTALFVPSVAEMYPQPTVLRFDFGALERVMEGAHRPGHFNGVATVVSKLFHMARPHRAYFGQKDWQQVAVIRQLVADLSFDLEILACPTIREADGLAMSSRNRRLDPASRAAAPLLHQVLAAAADQVRQGVPPAQVRAEAEAALTREPLVTPEYFEVADAQTLQPLEAYVAGRAVVLCLAAHLGGVRLIDNVVVEA
ncbi:pantoate--beta-alanine ligase [Hymenobacter sp. BT770]|uniref:pantoate--beta-alanine ligase n=1 Tax=Hymenobacter sp. BT770 TaxID=2886942 RepID=UPI001D12A5DF|nr:pantoate--beta-alanine ligase [Hymenobacter sp. BT770]MCC3153370.1 pantoate--beta-alanine ligase [Hymenobacter sp. BT770]MDO3415548.1 pantoate--beta-alanine ligase [Hymenobacter sp. BT770]